MAINFTNNLSNLPIFYTHKYGQCVLGDWGSPGGIHICSTIRQPDELLYCTARISGQRRFPGR